MTELVALDFETTGLFPEGNDRVIEIGAVRFDDRGNRRGEIDTLVDPHRDLGRTDIHGITAAEVSGAPEFADVLGDLIELFDGAVIVAHNAMFDLRFLESEVERCGFQLPSMEYVCTAQTLGGSLEMVCDSYGVKNTGAHQAISDARALVEVVDRWLKEASDPGDLRPWVFSGGGDGWPRVVPTGKRHSRDTAKEAVAKRDGFIGRMVTQLPVAGGVTDSPATVAYAELLDRVLDDRVVSANEAKELEQLADDWGLTRPEALRVHKAYLGELVAVALQDGRISGAGMRPSWWTPDYLDS